MNANMLCSFLMLSLFWFFRHFIRHLNASTPGNHLLLLATRPPCGGLGLEQGAASRRLPDPRLIRYTGGHDQS